LRVTLTWTLETLLCARVFREGAANCARGGRAPISISAFGLKPLRTAFRAAGQENLESEFRSWGSTPASGVAGGALAAGGCA
jgi:hypothetical protein